MMMRYHLLCLFILGQLFSFTVQAHKASDSYLYLENQQNALTAQWDIALRDLEHVIGLDTDLNHEITWAEVQARATEIQSYALSRLTVSAGKQTCHITSPKLMVNFHDGAAYATLLFGFDCAATTSVITIDYQLLFDVDPNHRGLVQFNEHATHVFSAANHFHQFQADASDKMNIFVTYVVEGVWHIWIGFDHILFLVTLLLPAVLLRRANHWQHEPYFKPALLDVVKIVTAFTIAHSITLTLAVLEIVTLPGRWVEVVIALSVLITAINNLYPVLSRHRWALAFGFGLIHGFGFANVLVELELSPAALGLSLFGFNLGVELGQLAIVAVYFPLAWLSRCSWVYRTVVFQYGSVAAGVIAMVWMFERIFDYELMGI